MAEVPSVNDRIVKMSAGLTDEAFGYDHWRAAQFLSPWRDREAFLVIVRPGEDPDDIRDRLSAALSVHHNASPDSGSPNTEHR